MANSVNKISFGSKIIVSSSAYLKTPRERLAILGKYVTEPWTIFDSKYLQEGFTDYASYCTMGVIKNKDGDAFMFHLLPGATRYRLIGEHIAKAAEILSKKSDLSGILVGGNAHSKESVYNYEFLTELLSKLKIKHSKLLGQKNQGVNIDAYCDLYYNGKKDLFVIKPPVLSPAVYSEISKIKTTKDKLQKIFRTVYIRNEDSIQMN